jgi:DNA polymerase-3 subunit delta
VSRALEDLRHAVIAEDPDVEVHEAEAGVVEPAELLQLLSPSLFGGRRLVVLRSAQDLPAARVQTIVPLLLDTDPETTVVVQHLGGAKGKAVLDAVRKAKPAEVSCAKLSRPEDRRTFLRNEVRRFRGRITPEAAATCARSRQWWHSWWVTRVGPSTPPRWRPTTGARPRSPASRSLTRRWSAMSPRR